MSKEQRIEALAAVLFSAWKDAEPNHSVTLNPVSYMSTFVDMARAAIDAMGPKDLVWAQIDGVTQGATSETGKKYTVWPMDGCGYCHFPGAVCGERFKSLQEAKDAANAHNRAAFWAMSKLGEGEG